MLEKRPSNEVGHLGDGRELIQVRDLQGIQPERGIESEDPPRPSPGGSDRKRSWQNFSDFDSTSLASLGPPGPERCAQQGTSH